MHIIYKHCILSINTHLHSRFSRAPQYVYQSWPEYISTTAINNLTTYDHNTQKQRFLTVIEGKQRQRRRPRRMLLEGKQNL